MLYAAVVREARRPDWYLAGEVPDTMDGRFDMIALVLSLLMLRLETETAGRADHPAAALSALLAERFIADMDGNLRQDGIGDQVVGKHIGRMMAALGGRLGAYRDAGGDDSALAAALARNMWRGVPPGDDALEWCVRESRRLMAALTASDFAGIAAGTAPF
nr:ubiquinol-cytochrome C chaperone family protein [Sandarakinorhabdus sp.]